MVERPYDRLVETVEHWWDGSWSELWRKDIWLKHDGRMWIVEARKGTKRDVRWEQRFSSKAEAQALVAAMIERNPGEWRRIDAGAFRSSRG